MGTNRAGEGWRFCAHADQDGEGAHWLEPGELCAEVAAEYPEVAAAIREDMAALAAMRQDRP